MTNTFDKLQDGEWPCISIVTPSFNQGRFIDDTIRSVLDQGYPNLEYMIIDGNSTDDSAAIIRSYGDRLKHWVSEPDRGQSHAINKGLLHCTGEIFNWLNADDVLLPGALHAVARAWRETPGHVIAGVEVDVYPDGREVEIVSRNLSLRNFIHWREQLRNGMQWGQPVTFLPLKAVRAAGGVRPDLRYSMDHLLMIEVLQHCDVAYIPDRLARFRIHEASKTCSAVRARFRRERIQAIRKMQRLPLDIPRRELREDLARTLVACARAEGRSRRYIRAAAHLMHAVCLSPGETRAAMHDFDWPGALLGKVLSACLPSLNKARPGEVLRT